MVFPLIMTFNLLSTECRLLITSANSLDPDQARQNVGPDLDPICLTFRWYSCNNFFEKVDFEKNQQTTTKHGKFPSMQS